MEEREVCRKRGEQAEYKEPSVTQTIASKPRLAFNPLFLTRKSALSSETLSADNNSFYSKAGGGVSNVREENQVILFGNTLTKASSSENIFFFISQNVV